MELKNFKPGQVWKMRAGGHVGIESISDDGGTHVVYARDLDTGSARNFNASGGYLNDGQATSDFDLVELAREAHGDAEKAEFRKIGGDELPDELKAILGGLFRRIADKASEQGETDGCAACTEARSRSFADHLIVTAIEHGCLDTAMDGAGLMKEIQAIMTARKTLTV